jgi:hypothetical protein
VLVSVIEPVATGSPFGPLTVTVIGTGKVVTVAGGVIVTVGFTVPEEFTVMGKLALFPA